MRRVALLLGGVAALGGVAYLFRPRPPVPPPPPAVAPFWIYAAPDPGGVVAAPLVADAAVYLAVYRAAGFRLGGAVYALDPATGRARWRFDAGGGMHPTASSPLLHGGRLYVGEGMHANFDCRLFGLDPATGKAVWGVPAADHIEAGPAAAGDLVYFAAGNEGVIAADVKTGAVRWKCGREVHVDSTPCLAGDRVVFGSGPSRKAKTNAVFAADALTGAVRWQTPTRLGAWGAPTAAGGRVVVGIGNGRLTEPAHPPEQPGGGVVCLALDDGKQLWEVRAADAVIQQPQVEGGRVYFGSRDGHLYCVNLLDGAVRFRVPVGGPVMAAPAVAGGRVYVSVQAGRVLCLDAADGREVWRYPLGTDVRAFAPVRVRGGRVYVAAEVRASVDAAGQACLFCLPADAP